MQNQLIKKIRTYSEYLESRQCSGKIAHKNIRDAKKAKRKTMKKYGLQNLEVYLCTFCNLYHCGRSRLNKEFEI